MTLADAKILLVNILSSYKKTDIIAAIDAAEARITELQKELATTLADVIELEEERNAVREQLAAAQAQAVPINDVIELLVGAGKWIRRLEERREDLPKSFFDNIDVMPLRKQMFAMVRFLEKQRNGISAHEGGGA
jgi:outer membrane murein-binding lipoprotein Lpp